MFVIVIILFSFIIILVNIIVFIVVFNVMFVWIEDVLLFFDIRSLKVMIINKKLLMSCK